MIERTPEEQQKWDEDHKRWKEARGRLVNLTAVLRKLDRYHSVMDAHGILKFVTEDPEGATICLIDLDELVRSIDVGQRALEKLRDARALPEGGAS